MSVDCIYLVHAFEMLHCLCQSDCLSIRTFIQRQIHTNRHEARHVHTREGWLDFSHVVDCLLQYSSESLTLEGRFDQEGFANTQLAG